MVRLNNYFSVRANQRIDISSFSLMHVKIKYAPGEEATTNLAEDSTLICKSLLDMIGDVLASPNHNYIQIIYKKAKETSIYDLVNKVGLEIIKLSHIVENYQLDAALVHTFKHHLFPTYVETSYRRQVYLFDNRVLFNRDKIKECIQLIKISLYENQVCLSMFERYAKRMQAISINSLPLTDETVEKFIEASSGHIDFEKAQVFMHALPNFEMIRIQRISKNIEALSNGLKTRESINEYWAEVRKIRLPSTVLEPNNDKIFFCRTPTGEIYPSCTLFHTVMDPAKFDVAGNLTIPFLNKAKNILQKMGIFNNTVEFLNPTNSMLNSKFFGNPKNYLALSEKALYKINTYVSIAPKTASQSRLLVITSKAAATTQSKLKVTRQSSRGSDKENPVKAKLGRKRKTVEEENQEGDENADKAPEPPPNKKKAMMVSNTNEKVMAN